MFHPPFGRIWLSGMCWAKSPSLNRMSNVPSGLMRKILPGYHPWGREGGR